MTLITFFNPHPRTCVLFFRREKGREGERERDVCLPHRSHLRIELATQASALTRDQTYSLFGVQDDTPTNGAIHPGQGLIMFLKGLWLLGRDLTRGAGVGPGSPGRRQFQDNSLRPTFS